MVKKQERRHRNTLEWTTLKLSRSRRANQNGCLPFYSAQLDQIKKKRQKRNFKKFVKLLDYTCVCNDFTNLECEEQATRNGSYVNLQKLALKKLVKIALVQLFFSGFLPFGTTVQCKHPGASFSSASRTASPRTPARKAISRPAFE